MRSGVSEGLKGTFWFSCNQNLAGTTKIQNVPIFLTQRDNAYFFGRFLARFQNPRGSDKRVWSCTNIAVLVGAACQ